MSLNHQDSSLENLGQSPGCDPKTNKRNSLFAFFKWFNKPSSREDLYNNSSSCDSLNSSHSASSFSYVPPSAYPLQKNLTEKCLVLEPETDTYKARLKQRDKRRENDKYLTLRKKYNLFFNRDTILKNVEKDEETTRSLPLMTKTTMEDLEADNNKAHRRTNSESSKVKKAGAYLHVKGKRRAPQPPNNKSNPSTLSLRRRNKRLAPPPPQAVLSNDSLKLDNGFLKPVKEVVLNPTTSTLMDKPVSPKPWFKRTTLKKELPDLQQDLETTPLETTKPWYKRNSIGGKQDPQNRFSVESKRKSGMSFLTNISELDREASEIVSQKHETEIPYFMRLKEETKPTDSWVSPNKRRSAKDLIAKFNAITNVKPSGIFQQKRENYGKRTSLSEDKKQEKSKIDMKMNALMKSESASAIKNKPETPKMERKSWNCPKCFAENDYWRIICHVCSTIKPYFDDFGGAPLTKVPEKVEKKSEVNLNVLERSRTQIGFSALASYNSKNINSKNEDKKEEKEKLKKMLIEMKNSLPKRKSNILMKQQAIKENEDKLEPVSEGTITETKSSIEENKNENKKETKEKTERKQEAKIEEKAGTKREEKAEAKKEQINEEKTQEERVTEILIGTKTTIYENIKVKPQLKKNEEPKHTDDVLFKTSDLPPNNKTKEEGAIKKVVAPKLEDLKAPNYELMRPKDFENIYSSPRIYANLAQNDDLSVFFNVPKRINDIKNSTSAHADTIEINRLLRRLESAIAKGELVDAAIYAKELAQLKVNCSVMRQKPPSKKKMGFNIEMYVEDKLSHRGPFTLEVTEKQTVLELKKQVEQEFEIPANVQRWILGKELASNDTATLKDHNICNEGCPVFLYLVAPEGKSKGEVLKEFNDAKVDHVPKIVKVIPKIIDATPKLLDLQPATSQSKIISAAETKRDEVKITKLEIQKNSQKTENTQPKLDLPSNSKFVTKLEVQKDLSTKLESNKNEENKESLKQIAQNISNLQFVIKKELPIKFDDQKKDPIQSGNSKNAATPSKIMETPEATSKLLNYKTDVQVFTVQANYSPGLEKLKTAPEQTNPEVSTTLARVEKPTGTLNIKSEIPKTVLDLQQTEAGSSGQSKEVQTQLTVKVQETPKQGQFKQPPEEEEEDYDTKTLKPEPKEWVCHLCTLLNPISSNICAVCATVRKKDVIIRRSQKKKAPTPTTYLQLVHLDNADLVKNVEIFECPVCFLEIGIGEGVTLRECLHQFCRGCLAQTVEYSEEAEVKCPYMDEQYSCNIALQDREIKALVTPWIYEQHLAKSVAQAENRIGKSFHCKTPDCKGWCIFEDNVNHFKCPVCRRINCLTCQAIHTGLNCKQYQERMHKESEIDEDAKQTKAMLDEMVNKGEALTCPTCKVILMKKWGCDWLRCSMCKTEICWVTRGPRWGPAGKGDTSGGCQCGLNGVKCHPQCNYCH